MDLDGDGVISMYEMEYFYREQVEKMEQLGIDTLPFEDTLCQVRVRTCMSKRRTCYACSFLYFILLTTMTCGGGGFGFVGVVLIASMYIYMQLFKCPLVVCRSRCSTWSSPKFKVKLC